MPMNATMLRGRPTKAALGLMVFVCGSWLAGEALLNERTPCPETSMATLLKSVGDRSDLLWLVDGGCTPYPQCEQPKQAGYVIYLQSQGVCLFITSEKDAVACRPSVSFTQLVLRIGTHDDG